MKRTVKPPRRRDPARWTAAGLVALALTGIGAMHAHVLMLRRGLDLLPAAAQAGGVILLAALPIGYLVYRFWFAEPRPLLRAGAGFVYAPDLEDDDDQAGRGLSHTGDIFDLDQNESGIQCGAWGCGTYAGGYRIDD